MGSWVREFMSSLVRGFIDSWVREFIGSWARGFVSSLAREFIGSWVGGFVGSWVRGGFSTLPPLRPSAYLGPGFKRSCLSITSY